MNISITGFTDSGRKLAGEIAEGLKRSGHSCAVNSGASLSGFTEEGFRIREGLIFVGAVGIAVRGVAPFLKDKSRDPAVVVVDEKGRWAISLVSGHLGGANHLAEEVARITGGEPVITTATDINGVFAVDVWAKDQGLSIGSMKKAKEVSAALLSGKQIGFVTDYPVLGDLPLGFVADKSMPLRIRVSIYSRSQVGNELLLMPKSLAIGIGCRKGVPYETVERAVLGVLEEKGIEGKCVAFAASIDLKKDEAGIIRLCEARGWPFKVYTSEELAAAQEDFTASKFVQEVTGVDNVCERAAVVAAGGGKLLVRKTSGDGVTVAVAEREFVLRF